jgi:hypothetical protein
MTAPVDFGGTDCLAAEIVDLARVGLPRMFNPERQLFCHALRRNTGGRLVQQGISHRYTMMTLLGLHRLEAAGTPSPIAIEPVIDELLRDLTWITNVGDLGVLLWLCAVVDPDRIKKFSAKLDSKNALVRYMDFRQRSTTELAWLLTGLAHARLATSATGMDALAGMAYDLLRANQGPRGIFGHLSARDSWAGRIRGHIGSFADQVYPIYALAQFGKAFGDKDAIRRARECAETIIRLQGPQGEWWWHYNAGLGLVNEPYPVYSVHQHGMAPMALFALGEAAGMDFSKAVDRGLRWIASDNVLGFDMRYPAGGLVWRGIYLDSYWERFQALSHFLILPGEKRTFRRPSVRYECRPYELGWALYAFASSRLKH